jgi:hypothetical protein
MPLRLLSLDTMAEVQPVPVAVLNIEITTVVGLVTHVAGNSHALRPEFSAQGVGIVDPDTPHVIAGAFTSHNSPLLVIEQVSGLSLDELGTASPRIAAGAGGVRQQANTGKSYCCQRL